MPKPFFDHLFTQLAENERLLHSEKTKFQRREWLLIFAKKNSKPRFLTIQIHFQLKTCLDMPFLTTSIADLVIFEPHVWADDRGYFYESYNEKTFTDVGIAAHFVQDNQARSTRGVLRGLHFQVGDAAQAKLVRCIEGEVLDVAVDLREGSATYGAWFSIRLSAENKRQLFVPRGFAHGYAVLSETAEFAYKCDNFYSKQHEGGLLFNDPTLKIDWEFDLREAVLSEKDLLLSHFGEHRKS